MGHANPKVMPLACVTSRNNEAPYVLCDSKRDDGNVHGAMRLTYLGPPFESGILVMRQQVVAGCASDVSGAYMGTHK